MTSSTNPAEGQMTFYDIALAPPVTKNARSPNPWKSRYALNFKQVDYKTTWVPLLDVSKVRGALNIPASRTFADGKPYHTLPVLSDPTTGRIVGDSFDIAVYLQEQYPTSGAGDLFPKQDLDFDFERDPALFAPIAEAKGKGHTEVYAKFNTNVDAVFTKHVPLMKLHFDPAVEKECKDEFSRRIGVPWESLGLTADQRIAMVKSFEESLGRLAALYKKDPSGPFLMGNTPTYADFIVGGWLRFSTTLPSEEWEALRGWHDGVFGTLHEALEGFAQMN